MLRQSRLETNAEEVKSTEKPTFRAYGEVGALRKQDYEEAHLHPPFMLP